MTWQDELRRLDEELAAGRLAAEEYRGLRDALLASQGGQPNSLAPENQEPQAARGSAHPAGQQEQTPFPPPFRWDSDGSEPTQRTQRRPGEHGDDTERTQVVPGQPGQQGTPGQQPYPGYPGYLAPSWQAEARPPWSSGGELPSTTDMPPAWYQQGPEFEADPGGSKLRRMLGLTAAVVLLLGISAAAYFLFRPAPAGQDDGQTTVTSSPTSRPTTTKPPGPPIADLPGNATDMSAVKTFADVEGINYLTPQEIEVYRRTAAGEAKVAISNDDGARIIVLVTKHAGADTTKAARNELADLQLRFKMDATTTQPGVLAARNDTVSGGPLRRAHYASGQYVVRIQVQGNDMKRVDQLFAEVLGVQLDELPADTNA